MRTSIRIMGLMAMILASLASGSAWATTFGPTSFEVLYQPTYTTGGSSSQLGSLGGGIRIGYAMTPRIGFELGGYYDSYVFGDVAGTNETVYAARVTGNFTLMPADFLRIYVGADANAYFNLPASLTAANQDIGVIAGLRFLAGSAVKFVFGAEYRYATAPALTYAGGAVNSSAVLGTIGFHFGGL